MTETILTFLRHGVVGKCVLYSTAEVDKRVRNTSLYHSRQRGVVLKPQSNCVCFITHY